MNTDNSWWSNWYATATDDEKRLIQKISEFEEEQHLFDDMLFQEGSSTYELLKIQRKSLDSNEFVDDVYRPEEVLDYFDYTWFHFNVSEPNVGEGEFCEADQTLTVSPAVLEDGITIPHELIHLHEFVINDLPMYYHDMVYWALYKDLRNKIPDLDDIITGHAHLLTGSTIYGEGGTHDILFLLKSFNLDIRMGYPLGTIFAYGRADIFKSYSYNRD